MASSSTICTPSQAKPLELLAHRAKTVRVAIGGDDQSQFRPAARTSGGVLPPGAAQRSRTRVACLNVEQQRNGLRCFILNRDCQPRRNASVRAGLPPLAANAELRSSPGSMRRPAFFSAAKISSRCAGSWIAQLRCGARLFASSSAMVRASPKLFEPALDEPRRVRMQNAEAIGER